MRKISHTERSEPLFEYLLGSIRSRKAATYIRPNTSVLDLGCGYKGTFLKNISKKIKEGIGFDISVTEKKIAKNVTLQKADLNKNFAGKKNYFDTITALAVLEHVESLERFLKNAKIMLKKNGRIIITTPHKRAKPVLEFLAFKVGLVSKEEIKDHKNYFDENSLKKLFNSFDLKIVKLKTFSFGQNILLIARKV